MTNLKDMGKIDLLCIGEQKFRSLKELEKDYIKKIGFFSGFSVKNLKEVKIKDEKIQMEREGKAILEKLSPGDHVIALDRRGKEMDSLKFANYLSDKISYSNKKLVFIIGGQMGLSGEVLKRSDLTLSFSKMTFAHDIFKIIFLEQLYRAFSIIKGTKYHR
ncbi:MAG: 23S rRNA (pseudouridine(1915)-N(3))-methyltransferase RlmH [Acidobacteriota bacterium]